MINIMSAAVAQSIADGYQDRTCGADLKAAEQCITDAAMAGRYSCCCNVHRVAIDQALSALRSNGYTCVVGRIPDIGYVEVVISWEPKEANNE